MQEEEKLEEDNTQVKQALLCEIGKKLTQARKEKKLSLEQVVDELKIGKPFLIALENGNWSEMPGEIYALGFLRQYTSLLEIDLSEDTQRIKTDTYELTTPLTYPDAPISPNRTWVVVSVLLFTVIFIFINLFDSEQEKHVGFEVTEQLSPSLVTPEDTVSLADESASTPAPKSEKVSLANIKPTVNNSSQKKKTSAPINHYTFTAISDDVWLQVYEQLPSKGENLRREVLLQQGESFSLESKHLLLITAGKPTVLEVKKGDVVLYKHGELGQLGKILKLFPLE